jgi:hypothetical protein
MRLSQLRSGPSPAEVPVRATAAIVRAVADPRHPFPAASFNNAISVLLTLPAAKSSTVVLTLGSSVHGSTAELPLRLEDETACLMLPPTTGITPTGDAPEVEKEGPAWRDVHALLPPLLPQLLFPCGIAEERPRKPSAASSGKVR